MRGKLLALGITLCFGIVATSDYTLELYLVADDKVKDMYINTGTPRNQVASKIREDALYSVSEVNKIFQRMKSKGVDIDVKLTKLDVLNKNVFTSASNGRIQNKAGIKDLMAYLKTNGAQSRYKYDIALLLTGYDLQNDARTFSIAGRAKFGTVCQSENVGIAVFKGTYKSIMYLAHEILHVLGIYHDIKYSEKCEKGTWLMGTKTFRWPSTKWDASDCTINALKKELPTKTCLKKTQLNSYTPNVNVPKDYLDMDLMCKRLGFRYMCKDPSEYQNAYPQGDYVCQRVVCFNSQMNKCYDTIHSTNGIVCGKGKRCNFNKCEPASDVPADIKDDCVFGDQLVLNVNGKTTTCQDYFKRESKTEKCKDNNIKNQCCKTCQKSQPGTVIFRKRCTSRRMLDRATNQFKFATTRCMLVPDPPAGVDLEIVLLDDITSNTCKYGGRYELAKENGKVYIKVSNGCNGYFHVKTK